MTRETFRATLGFYVEIDGPTAMIRRFNCWRAQQGIHPIDNTTGRTGLESYTGVFATDDAERIVAWLRRWKVPQKLPRKRVSAATKPKIEHTARAGLTRSGAWRGGCSCGWRGRVFEDANKAQAAAERHREKSV